jgi:hypothetical protein
MLVPLKQVLKIGHGFVITLFMISWTSQLCQLASLFCNMSPHAFYYQFLNTSFQFYNFFSITSSFLFWVEPPHPFLPEHIMLCNIFLDMVI